MWQKLILLMVYLIFYLMILRSWDWFYYDFWNVTMPTFLDPFALNARQIRAVLDTRGIFYTGLLEKKELLQLVHESGGVNAADMDAVDCVTKRKSNLPNHQNTETTLQYASGEANGHEMLESEVQHFTSARHFNEQVEDCKDSAWIVQVIMRGRTRPLHEHVWLRLIESFSKFGIRFGVFDCQLDYRMCQHRRWNTSRLLLALPEDGDQAKSAVTTYTYEHGAYGYRYQALTQWIHDRIGSRVRRLNRGKEMSSWMNRTCVSANSICLLLVTSLTLPPFFISALSVKFNGRVKFGMVGHAGASGFGHAQGEDEENERTMSNGATMGRYVLISPSPDTKPRILSYGGRRNARQASTYESLHFFLKWFTPDLNDIFVLSVAFANLLALLTLFECRGHPIRIFLYFAWIALKYNFLLLLIWAFLLSMINYQCVTNICNNLLNILRTFSCSSYGQRVISDFNRRSIGLSNRWNWIIFIFSFSTFNTLVYWIRKRFGLFGDLVRLDETRPSNGNHGDSNGNWFVPLSLATSLRFSTHNTLWGAVDLSIEGEQRRRLFNFDDPFSERTDLDPRLETLIRRFGIRNVCLDPHVPYDYILDIPNCEYKSTWNIRLQSSTGTNKESARCCPVCLDMYGDEDRICILPCDHDFHQRCILSWLFQDQPTCPCCRQAANIGKKSKIW